MTASAHDVSLDPVAATRTFSWPVRGRGFVEGGVEETVIVEG